MFSHMELPPRAPPAPQVTGYMCILQTEAAWDIPEADWGKPGSAGSSPDATFTVGAPTGCRVPDWAT